MRLFFFSVGTYFQYAGHQNNRSEHAPANICQSPVLHSHHHRRYEDVRSTHVCHKQCGQQTYEQRLPVLCKVYCDAPQGDAGKRLVHPRKVAPDGLEG